MKNWNVWARPCKISELIASLIRIYQKTISPDHGRFLFFPGVSGCRFYPSCSDYTVQALRQYGLFSGLVLSLKRILKCNPWHGGGYDPLK